MRRDFLLFILSILLALGVAALVWEYADARAGPFPVPFTDADGKPSLVRLYVDAGGEAFYVPLYALLAGAFLLAAIVGASVACRRSFVRSVVAKGSCRPVRVDGCWGSGSVDGIVRPA